MAGKRLVGRPPGLLLSELFYPLVVLCRRGKQKVQIIKKCPGKDGPFIFPPLFTLGFLFLSERKREGKRGGKMGPDHLCLEETIHLLESQRQAKTLTACLDFSKEWFSQARSGPLRSYPRSPFSFYLLLPAPKDYLQERKGLVKR